MRLIAVVTTILLLLLMQGRIFAQAAPAGDAPAQDTSAQEVSVDQESSKPLLDEAALDQLVAPIALYPDPLLAQVLVGSTYPLEVVQAERWVEAHKDVKGEALTEALEEEDWDNSIKALVAVPDVLSMMNKDLDWTAKLGDAVLAQQADVMAAVQRMRELAHENGQLESNDQQTVTVKQVVNVDQPAASSSDNQAQPAQQVIVIEPTSPETVYVPYYEPSVVYGTWPYPSYPPYYFPPPPGYAFGGALARGVAWSAGFAIGNAIWGDGFNWGRNDIYVDVNRNIDFNQKVDINNKNINVSNWQHNADHRRGVNYNNAEVRNKFSKGDLSDKRQDFRGRENGLGDKRPGGAGLADKKPGTKRPSVGDMEAALKQKPDLGDKRPGGGLADKKPGAGDERPNVGDMEKALKQKPDLGDKRPGGGLADKKPGGEKRPAAKKPDIGDKRAALKKPDAAKRPAAKKPAAKKPAGNAFDRRDGAKAKDFSKRGRSSVGNRSAAKLGGRPSAHRGGGGHRGGRGGRRR